MLHKYALCRIAILAGAAIATGGPANAGTYLQLHAFRGSGDGAHPATGLTLLNGNLYGTTPAGGAGSCLGSPKGCGSVYSVDPATGDEQVVFSFNVSKDLVTPTTGLTDVDGTLYGGTLDAIYSLNPTNDEVYPLYSLPKKSGNSVVGNLLKVHDKLFGVASYGPNRFQNGVVFSVKRNSGHGVTLFEFRNEYGRTPEGGLIDDDGMLYGTASLGGAYKSGTVFALDPTTHAVTVVYSFGSDGDGLSPYGSLLDFEGTLYGTTYRGGAFDAGTVFSLNPTTGAEAVVYSFKSSKDGILPLAGLVEFHGKLYGTTSFGGASNDGTIFRIDPITGVERVLYSFEGHRDGAYPKSGLTRVGKTLYGTTFAGGDTTCISRGCGTVFSYTP
ncbi:MAG TPA: choice-of-anchor tandem repeat GloVer-containing protein [Acetobacteraceae bacterium]|nr:choice-of-anchor tandem repeat GloVer-containing protein [Acetobacteraceae bacterium]